MAMSKRIGIWLKASPPLAVLWLPGPGRLVFSTGLSSGQKGLWWDPRWARPWEGTGSWPPSPSASGLHFCVWKRGMHKARVQNWMKFSSPIPLISCLLIVSRNKSHWDVYSLPVRVCSPEIVPGPFFSASVMLGSQERHHFSKKGGCGQVPSGLGWSLESKHQSAPHKLRKPGALNAWSSGPFSRDHPIVFSSLKKTPCFLLRPRCCLSSYTTPCGLWTKVAVLPKVVCCGGTETKRARCPSSQDLLWPLELIPCGKCLPFLISCHPTTSFPPLCKVIFNCLTRKDLTWQDN